MKHLKKMLGIRGDNLYCPLSFSLDTYGNCLTDCWHCYLRRLNYVWGTELKPGNPDEMEKQLLNGLKNSNPRSPIAWAIKNRKTLRVGNKADPYQDAEMKYGVTRDCLKILKKLKWSVVIQTRFLHNMMRDLDIIKDMDAIIMPMISPGMEKDWEVLERKRTTPIKERLEIIKQLIKSGMSLGCNGEPFIPGFHSVRDFRSAVKRLSSCGVSSYNIYPIHANDFVYKRLNNIGIDVLEIWEGVKDEKWKPVLLKLIQICQRNNMDLGCPDFVNSGTYVEKANTCCGLTVPNPTRFNAITWKKMLLEGKDPEEILKETYDGINSMERGRAIMYGTDKDMYNMKDAGFDLRKPK